MTKTLQSTDEKVNEEHAEPQVSKHMLSASPLKPEMRQNDYEIYQGPPVKQIESFTNLQNMCQSSNPYLDKLNLDYPSGVKETEEDHEESPSVIEKR